MVPTTILCQITWHSGLLAQLKTSTFLREFTAFHSSRYGMQLQVLFEKLVAHPSLLVQVSFTDMTSFTWLATLVQPAIAFQVFNLSNPPNRLPLNVHTFLATALDLSWEIVVQCWHVFADDIWSSTSLVAATKPKQEHFRRFDLPQGISYRDMYPPTHVCLQHNCANFRTTNERLTLQQPAQYDTTLFTKGEGALPIFSHSTYCASMNHIHIDSTIHNNS
ncbi:hypothetical protein K439DRAFT_1624936 [Ramaria rubella]|nr:hypothetical protein K439DRAFT_1624936 [Ramaria rubella]